MTADKNKQINVNDISTLNNEENMRRIKSASGKPVIGYLCCFAPPEIISAAGAIPYRITGEPGLDTSAADAYTEPYGCTYVRNILARAVEGKLDFLDGLVISHSCDMVQRLYGIWTFYHPLPYSYMFNVPHQTTPWAQDFFKRELHFFRESLEKFTGKKVTDEKLKAEIALQNSNRLKIRKLYAMRRENPPLIEGSEMLGLLLAGGSLPADQFASKLDNALDLILKRKSQQRDLSAKPRVMIWGSIMDNPALFKIIEQAGGSVVADDTCIGSRVWDKDIPQSGDPYEDLKEHYFINFQCPRTDRGPGTERFDYLLQRTKDYNVQGVIGYSISFCDPHKFDYPDLRDYLKKAGLPMLLIDDNYSFEPEEAIKTRVQAFLEML